MQLDQVVEVPPHRIKMFVMTTPVLFEHLLMLRVYEAESRTNYEWCVDALRVVMRESELKERYLDFADQLIQWYEESACAAEFDGGSLLEQTLAFFKALSQELVMSGMYIGGSLHFNAFWMDKPDTLIFFRMEKGDVEYPQ